MDFGKYSFRLKNIYNSATKENFQNINIFMYFRFH